MRKNGGMVLMMRHADVYDNPGTTRRLYGNLDGFWLSQLGVRQAGALPGLEHPEKTQRRVVECIERAIQRYPGRNLLFVTHGDPMCFLFEYLRGESLEPLVSYPLGVNKATVFMACFEPGIEPDEAVRKLFEPGEYSTVYPRPK